MASKKSKKPRLKPDTSVNWKYAPGCIFVDDGTEHGGDVILDMGRDGIGPAEEDGLLMAAAPLLLRTLERAFDELLVRGASDEILAEISHAFATALPVTTNRRSKKQ